MDSTAGVTSSSTPWPLDLMPHWRLPSDLGFGPDKTPDPYMLGDIWVTRHREGPCAEYITVDDKASPQILIGDELLRDIQFDRRSYNTCAWVELKDPDYEQHLKSECLSCARVEFAYQLNRQASFCFAGKMFHINARNRQLIYRIGQYRPQSRTWEAGWPD